MTDRRLPASILAELDAPADRPSAFYPHVIWHWVLPLRKYVQMVGFADG